MTTKSLSTVVSRMCSAVDEFRLTSDDPQDTTITVSVCFKEAGHSGDHEFQEAMFADVDLHYDAKGLTLIRPLFTWRS